MAKTVQETLDSIRGAYESNPKIKASMCPPGSALLVKIQGEVTVVTVEDNGYPNFVRVIDAYGDPDWINGDELVVEVTREVNAQIDWLE